MKNVCNSHRKNWYAWDEKSYSEGLDKGYLLYYVFVFLSFECPSNSVWSSDFQKDFTLDFLTKQEVDYIVWFKVQLCSVA